MLIFFILNERRLQSQKELHPQLVWNWLYCQTCLLSQFLSSGNYQSCNRMETSKTCSQDLPAMLPILTKIECAYWALWAFWALWASWAFWMNVDLNPKKNCILNLFETGSIAKLVYFLNCFPVEIIKVATECRLQRPVHKTYRQCCQFWQKIECALWALWAFWMNVDFNPKKSCILNWLNCQTCLLSQLLSSGNYQSCHRM